MLFNRTVSVTGGSPQRLSTVMQANGYTGSFALSSLALRNPAAASAYFGQSDVSAANGVDIPPSESFTFPAVGFGDAVDPAQIYIFVAVTQNLSIVARTR